MCALASAIALTGCAERKEPVGPWGYTFAVRNVRDLSPDGDSKMMNATPFRSDHFARSWKTHMPDRVFGSQPASLDVIVEHYQATHGRKSYALSMETRLRGVDQYGGLLAETPATCSAVAEETGEFGTFGQQVAEQRSITPLTPRAREATMWQKVLDLCVKDLAIQFGQALTAGRPAATALK